MITIVSNSDGTTIFSHDMPIATYHAELATLCYGIINEISNTTTDKSVKTTKKDYVEGLILEVLKALAEDGIISERKEND